MRNESTGLLVELAKQCRGDSQRWFGDAHTPDSLAYHTLAMCGEAGEFANVVKKVERGSLNIHDASVRIMLAEELTDTFVYMLNIADIIGVDLEKTYNIVRGKNDKRFTQQRKEREAKHV